MSMTMHERMLAVMQGRSHDRVPFVQYDDAVAPNEEIWQLIGRETMGLLCGHGAPDPTPALEIRGEAHPTPRLKVNRTLHTPAGDLTEEVHYEPTYGTGSIREHFIKEPQDYYIFMAFRATASYGTTSATTCAICARWGTMAGRCPR